MTIDTRQSPIPVSDQIVLRLEGKRVEKHGEAKLELTYEGQDLSDHRFLIEHRLRTVTEYRVRLADFESEGQRFIMNGMTVKPDGALVSWGRVDGAAESPVIARPTQGDEEFRFVALAVCPETLMVLAEPYPGVLNTTMLTGDSDDDETGSSSDDGSSLDPDARSGPGTLTGG